MKKLIVLISLTFLGFTACETNIDINADYRQIPVVYGLLEANKDFQFIKINRSFLGEGNALVAALNPDSSFYTNINPVVEQYSGNEILKTIALRDTVLADREEGDFYSSPNRYYYFRNQNGFLEEGGNYRLRFDANGQEVTAEATLIGSFDTQNPRSFADEIGVVANDAIIQNKVEYRNLDLLLTTQPNVRLYESEIKFEYKTVYNNGDTVLQEVVIPIGEDVTARLTGGDRVNNILQGNQIFNTIGNNANFETDDESTVQYREIGTVTLRVTAASDDLNTYLESVSPSTGVVLEKPQFSNVSFGDDELGVGVFTSRFNYSKTYDWDTRTVKAFAIAEGTAGKRFCSFRPEVLGSNQIDCRNFQ